MKVFIDTHVAVAVYEGLSGMVSAFAAEQLRDSAVFISPVVAMELHMLHEIGRLTHPSPILTGLAEQGVHQSDDAMAHLVPHFAQLRWTRDPFDRLIVATCMHHRAPLVTRDRRILAHFPDAVA